MAKKPQPAKKATLRERIIDELNKNVQRSSEEIASIVGSCSRYVRIVRKEENYANYIPKYLTPKINTPKLPNDDLKDGIKAAVRKRDNYTLTDLADKFDTGPSKIKRVVEELIAEGHTLKLDNGVVLFSTTIPKGDPHHLSIAKMSTGFYKVGAIADTHAGSRYERQDVWNAMYDHFQEEGVKTVFHGGNWIDGEARFNIHDLVGEAHGMDHQINYFLQTYPQREGIITKLITGDDHEGWYSQKFGVNVGEIMQNRAFKTGRKDLEYIGHMEADIIFKAPKGQTVLRILHPGGGSAYATSYTAQKIVESYTGGEKPDILFIGHYHKAEYSYIRGVHTVQMACGMDQSPFMRKKRLAAHLGGWIIEFAVDDYGAVTRFKQEFFPFYDKKYYSDKKWEYKW